MSLFPVSLFPLGNSRNGIMVKYVFCSGLKPGQRKVLFTCMKRNDKREVKVAQLAGSVAEMSAYHHGEVQSISIHCEIRVFHHVD